MPLSGVNLGVTNTPLHFAFTVGIPNATGHGHSSVVREQVVIQRIDRWIVDVRPENAFAQIVEHQHVRLCEGPDYAQEDRLS
jgi:hypothetical protein